jgi:glycerol-3-phosphate dehydrogenase
MLQRPLASLLTSEERRAVLDWRPPSRITLINDLKASGTKDNEYDLVIIGGGATGTGCALDGASRGLKVALLERDDFSSGTSSKSTKLVHGGVRYLEKAFLRLDYEQFLMVKEALAERSTFLRIAPHLTETLPIMLPIYRWWQIPYYWAGSKAYDLVAGQRGLQGSYFLSKSRALQVFPMLRKDSLVGAMVYYDGAQNDARTNVALALTAIQQGGTVTNYTEVVDLIKEPVKGEREGLPQIRGVIVKDRQSGETFKVYCKGVISATGPFCDLIRKMDDPTCDNLVQPSVGTHIVFPSYYSPRQMGLVDPASSDGRVIFFLPWEGNTIAGTTGTLECFHNF